MTDQEKQELSDDRAAMFAAKAELQEAMENAKFAFHVAERAFSEADVVMAEAEGLWYSLAEELEDFEENW